METIAELRDLIRGSLIHYPHIDPDELRFVVVHSRDTILPELSDELGAYARERLERRGIDASALSPWYFPGVEDYTALLQGAGFRVQEMELFPRPTQIPGGIEDWLWTFCEGFLKAVPDGGRRAFIAELEEALAPELADGPSRWSVDYVRLRFHAVRD